MVSLSWLFNLIDNLVTHRSGHQEVKFTKPHLKFSSPNSWTFLITSLVICQSRFIRHACCRTITWLLLLLLDTRTTISNLQVHFFKEGVWQCCVSWFSLFWTLCYPVLLQHHEMWPRLQDRHTTQNSHTTQHSHRTQHRYTTQFFLFFFFNCCVQPLWSCSPLDRQPTVEPVGILSNSYEYWGFQVWLFVIVCQFCLLVFVICLT